MNWVEFIRFGLNCKLRIVEAFMQEGYRVLTDKEGYSTKSWVDKDGKSDRIFATKEEAETAVLNYCNKLLKVDAIKWFTIF